MKKLLLLIIIPFLSFGQCEDESACNYDSDFYYYVPNDVPCEYVGDYCVIYDEDVGEFINPGFYSWDENCECSPPPGCEDETACNYNSCPFPGWYILGPDNTGDLLVLDYYSEPPFCVNPGDSCNIFYENVPLPSPYGYSGVLNSDCECVCTNPENINQIYFDGNEGEFIQYEYTSCPENEGEFIMNIPSCPEEEGCYDAAGNFYSVGSGIDYGSCNGISCEGPNNWVPFVVEDCEEVCDTVYIETPLLVTDTIVEIVEFTITEYIDCDTGLPCISGMVEIIEKSKYDGKLYNLLGQEIFRREGIYIEGGEIKYRF